MDSRFALECSPGSKLSLCLSAQTLRVLYNDITCFSGGRNPLSPPRFIAAILKQFAEEADSSVYRRCELSDLKEGSAAWKKLQDALCEKAAALLCRPRRTKTFSLNNAICSFSTSALAANESTVPYDWTGRKARKRTASSCYLYGKFEEYAAALLEEYASLSYSHRERIFFHSTCKCLEHAVSDQRALHLVSFSHPTIHYRFWPRPKGGALLSDPFLPYNYLVGYSMPETDASAVPQGGIQRHPASFRLSEILQISEAGSTDLTRAEIDALEDAIERKGIAYLFSENEDLWALVCFSKEGAAEYRKRLTNRPTGERIPELEAVLPGLPDGAEVWCLRDRRWKTTVYLRSFGGSVYLFSAQELTPKFLDILAAALLNAHGRGKRKTAEPEKKAQIAAELMQTYMNGLKENIISWNQRALAGADIWTDWIALTDH